MVIARQREIEALDLRIKGFSFRAIGEALGMTEGGAGDVVKRVLRDYADRLSETSPEATTLELQRLDEILVAIWPYCVGGPELDSYGVEVLDDEGRPKVKEPDPAYLAQYFKLTERRAKLRGLDVSRVELSGPGGGPIQVAPVDLARLSTGQLDALAGLLEAAGVHDEDKVPAQDDDEAIDAEFEVVPATNPAAKGDAC